ncbi:unnamed protein product [Effrenium voratum]|nr:unnamed protein product [Effrenium voratum]
MLALPGEVMQHLDSNPLHHSQDAEPRRSVRTSRQSRHSRRGSRLSQSNQRPRAGSDGSDKHGRARAGSHVSHVALLSEGGEAFCHHFGARNSLPAEILGATLQDAGPDPTEEPRLQQSALAVVPAPTVEDPLPTSRARIPRDVRLPAFLVVLCATYNNTAYPLEFNTFAIYFEQVHNWNEATWASLAAGDLLAAIAIKLIPMLFKSRYDPDEASCCRRFWHNITSNPCNLSLILFT